MSRHNHLNQNAHDLAPENTSPDWTGPHPDWSLHAIRLTMEAGFRDVVDAIERAARRGDEQGNARERARQIHHDLSVTRAAAAEAATKVATVIGEHPEGEATAALHEALVALAAAVPGLDLPADDDGAPTGGE